MVGFPDTSVKPWGPGDSNDLLHQQDLPIPSVESWSLSRQPEAESPLVIHFCVAAACRKGMWLVQPITRAGSHTCEQTVSIKEH